MKGVTESIIRQTLEGEGVSLGLAVFEGAFAVGLTSVLDKNSRKYLADKASSWVKKGADYIVGQADNKIIKLGNDILDDVGKYAKDSFDNIGKKVTGFIDDKIPRLNNKLAYQGAGNGSINGVNKKYDMYILLLLVVRMVGRILLK